MNDSAYADDEAVDAVSLEELLAGLIDRHGARFMETVAVQTDRQIVEVDPDTAVEMQRRLRAGLRAAKMGATARTRNALTFMAYRRAQTRGFYLAEWVKNGGLMPAHWPAIPSPVAYATAVAAYLESSKALPATLPPPPPPPFRP